jgi:hypothetical protein
MKRIAPWLLPTLVAPMIGAVLYVALVAQVVDLPVRVPTFVWVLAAGAASAVSLVIGGMMAMTDVALLKLKLRTPPTGWRVWAMGLLAPMPVLFTWQKLVRFAVTGLPQFLLAFFAPMLAVALVARLVLGARPKTW